jgi:tetratricopeptide (TPR) repeat protein
MLLLLATVLAAAGEGEGDVIRLTPSDETAASESANPIGMTESRRGFDYASFQARLESLWFQRKTLLANGRDADSRAQLEEIRAFCAEEGITRIEDLAGALIAEAHRFRKEGNDSHALSALEFAEAFDPGRPQVYVARAVVLWGSGGGVVTAAREFLRALRASVLHALENLSLLPRLVIILGLAWLGAALAFAMLMLLRHQASFRHEIEEWAADTFVHPWPEIIGWTALALPLITWVGAGWAPLYWMVITYRFMTRSERLTTACLLVAGALAVPFYGITVGLYGTSADPAVRTTVTSVEGEYDPDRIVRLRQLVETHPDDPVYRFLLAGVYKNGRYFEEAFDEYRAVIEREPSFVPAHINIGNIYYVTGQYAAAITSYHNAIAFDADSFLAHFNLHLAQSEDFHFSEAEQSLQRAREIDADRVAQLLGRSNDYDDRAAVQDAALKMVSVWEAAVGGRAPATGAGRKAGVAALLRPAQFLNPLAIACGLALLGCFATALVAGGKPVARPCIRCGRAFCLRCTSGREAQEYCSQCLHLYVLRDGLAPETKAKKVYEVERHERNTRGARRVLSVVLPGAGHVVRGKTGRGLLLIVVWLALLISVAPELFSLSSTGGLRLSTDLLLPPEVPMRFDPHPGRYLAALVLPCVWLAGNWRIWRLREA